MATPGQGDLDFPKDKKTIRRTPPGVNRKTISGKQFPAGPFRPGNIRGSRASPRIRTWDFKSFDTLLPLFLYSLRGGTIIRQIAGNGLKIMSFLNRLIVNALQRFPRGVVKPVAMRYIAGEGLEDAVRAVRGLTAKKMMATLDVLGEDVSRREEAEEAVQAGERALDAITREQLNSNLSVKLTQLGIKVDPRLAYENLKRIVERARSIKNFVRIDMEDSSLTGVTLDLYRKLRGEGLENVGVVIQAYLRRSEEDVKRLIPTRANVRMVKGIYNEPEAIAFQDREEIRRNFSKLFHLLLERGCYVGIATHDDVLVENAYQFIRKMNLSPDAYEFQMLYGVRPGLRDEIVAGGHRMRIYVPFGKQWYPYSMRRFQENPQMARYVLRALFIKE
jgi:proline dehydrogenase